MPRDPRQDPLPGDELGRPIPQSLNGYVFRSVQAVRGGGYFVAMAVDNGYKVRSDWCSIVQWRKWARKAEVIKIQGELL